MDINPCKFEAPWEAYELANHCLREDVQVSQSQADPPFFKKKGGGAGLWGVALLPGHWVVVLKGTDFGVWLMPPRDKRGSPAHAEVQEGDRPLLLSQILAFCSNWCTAHPDDPPEVKEQPPDQTSTLNYWVARLKPLIGTSHQNPLLLECMLENGGIGGWKSRGLGAHWLGFWNWEQSLNYFIASGRAEGVLCGRRSGRKGDPEAYWCAAYDDISTTRITG
jgi:hypothetical protein